MTANPMQIATLRWYSALQTSAVVRVAQGSVPTGVAFDGVNVWVANYGFNTVTKFAASSGAILDTFSLGGVCSGPTAVAYDGFLIWVANYKSNNVIWMTTDGTILGSVVVGTTPSWLAFDGSNMWVANYNSNTVMPLAAGIGPSIGPPGYAPGSVINTVNVGTNPSGMAFDGTNIWVTNQGSDNVIVILAATGAIQNTFPVGPPLLGSSYGPSAIAFDGTHMWITNSNTNTVVRMALNGTIVKTCATGSYPNAVAFDGTNIWTANFGDNISPGTVTKLLASTGAILGTYTVGIAPAGVAFDGVNIWVPNEGSDSISKL